MDFMEISKKRRSVRRYSDKSIEREKLEKILEAGRWAPTAVNGQPQRILVLDSKEDLKKVSAFCTFGYDKKYIELAKECENKEEQKNTYYYGAPTVLLVCFDKDNCWIHPESGKSSGETDAVIVTTHMMLEAASLDIGSVWISYFDTAKAKEMLNIPKQYEAVCMLYLGYPAKDIEPVKNPTGRRRPISETVFYHEFR